MNVVRMNTAHITREGALKIMNNVKSVSDKIPFLIDTKGPEVRTCNMEKSIQLLSATRLK
jgi:pyruvate kinase